MIPAVAGGCRRRAVPVAVVALLAGGLAWMVLLVVELAAPPSAAGHHDILAFWAAGRLIVDGRPGDLYDAAALTAIQRTVIATPIGMNGYMPFINPPVAAVVFAPLSALPVATARVLWAMVCLALAAAAAAWITRDLGGRERVAGIALIATSYPMYHALAEGQWSILLLVAGLAALAAARRGAWTLAGVALAILWLKPQFIFLPLLALVLARRWRAVAAAVLAGAGAVLVALPVTGLPANVAYLAYLSGVVTSHFAGAGPGGAAVWQGDLASTEGINGLLVGWLGQGSVGLVNALWAILVAGLGSLYVLAARARRPGFATASGRTMLAAGMALVLLVNPNQFVQDCVLLFLVLDILGPMAFVSRLSAIAATVGVADLTFVDLQVPALHLFTLVTVAGVLWACGKALRTPGDRVARRASGPTER